MVTAELMAWADGSGFMSEAAAFAEAVVSTLFTEKNVAVVEVRFGHDGRELVGAEWDRVFAVERPWRGAGRRGFEAIFSAARRYSIDDVVWRTMTSSERRTMGSQRKEDLATGGGLRASLTE